MITKKRLLLCEVQQRNAVRGPFVREFLQLVFIIFPIIPDSRCTAGFDLFRASKHESGRAFCTGYDDGC